MPTLKDQILRARVEDKKKYNKIKEAVGTMAVLWMSQGVPCENEKELVEKLISLGLIDEPSIAETTSVPRKKQEIIEIKISDIEEHPENAQIYGNGGPDENLVESIRQHGVLTPIVVLKNASGGWTTVSGHQRISASKLCGRETIRCIPIQQQMDDDEVVELLIELNFQREKTAEQRAREFSRLKKARQKIAEKNRRNGAGVRVEDVDRVRSASDAAAAVGWSEGTARKAEQVVADIDSATTLGDSQKAEKLREVLNSGKIDRAHKVSRPRPKSVVVEFEEENDCPNECPMCKEWEEKYVSLERDYAKLLASKT